MPAISKTATKDGGHHNTFTIADRADRPAVSEQEAIRILQSAVARGELDAAVVAALATQVRSSGAR